MHTDVWLVPSLWSYEFANVILQYDRAGKLSDIPNDIFIQGQKLVTISNQFDCSEIYSIAKKFGLSFYDASYVQIAISQNVKFFTRDKKILREFKDVACDTQSLV